MAMSRSLLPCFPRWQRDSMPLQDTPLLLPPACRQFVPNRISEFSECRPGRQWGHKRVATILLLRCGKSAYPLPSECPDLPLFRRARPYHNCQFVARYLELAYEISSYIGGGKRTFEVVCNGVIGFVYGVRTKICFVSVEQQAAVITLSGARRAAINCCGSVRSHELHSHMPA